MTSKNKIVQKLSKRSQLCLPFCSARTPLLTSLRNNRFVFTIHYNINVHIYEYIQWFIRHNFFLNGGCKKSILGMFPQVKWTDSQSRKTFYRVLTSLGGFFEKQKKIWLKLSDNRKQHPRTNLFLPLLLLKCSFVFSKKLFDYQFSQHKGQKCQESKFHTNDTQRRNIGKRGDKRLKTPSNASISRELFGISAAYVLQIVLEPIIYATAIL